MLFKGLKIYNLIFTLHLSRCTYPSIQSKLSQVSSAEDIRHEKSLFGGFNPASLYVRLNACEGYLRNTNLDIQYNMQCYYLCLP